jgi:hypothetical protein
VDDRHPATFQAPDGLAEILATTPAGSAHFRVRLSRVFRCPTGVDARTSVDLVIEPIVVPGILRLNSVPLGPLRPGPNRYAIAQHLQNANELQLDLEFDSAVIDWQTIDGPRIDVRLEIV